MYKVHLVMLKQYFFQMINFPQFQNLCLNKLLSGIITLSKCICYLHYIFVVQKMLFLVFFSTIILELMKKHTNSYVCVSFLGFKSFNDYLCKIILINLYINIYSKNKDKIMSCIQMCLPIKFL